MIHVVMAIQILVAAVGAAKELLSIFKGMQSEGRTQLTPQEQAALMKIVKGTDDELKAVLDQIIQANETGVPANVG